MKVVLFCGGLGTRIREHSESVPKPLVNIGYRPIIWHIMRYYAHYGHKDFILCLGYKADTIKSYFLNYDETVSNDFVLSQGGDKVELLNSDINDWKITFVDTGLSSNIGQRLRAVEKHLANEEVFLANYADGLTDLYLPDYLDAFLKSKKTGSFLSVKPTQSFHVVSLKNDGEVAGIEHIGNSDLWINAGYFVFRKEIFSYIKEGEELVNEPYKRLIDQQQLMTMKYKGFWVAMDTFKDKQYLDDLFSKDKGPWEVWKTKNR
jgi:glucose-1-phosphate cytidylyltransferase